MYVLMPTHTAQPDAPRLGPLYVCKVCGILSPDQALTVIVDNNRYWHDTTTDRGRPISHPVRRVMPWEPMPPQNGQLS